MALKPPVSENKPFEVNYQADVSSGGVTLLIVGWVPKHGHEVPAPAEVTIAPGMSGTISGTVPADAAARRMEIRVDLPDGAGKGCLALSVAGDELASDDISEDTLWTSIVV
jgi:hypothetical protein